MIPYDLKKYAKPAWVDNTDLMFAMEDVKPLYSEHHELSNGCWLFIGHEEHITYYALFQWYGSDDSGDYLQHVFSGTGVGSALREFRHTHWGSEFDGYTSYLPMQATIEALQILQKHFDD